MLEKNKIHQCALGGISVELGDIKRHVDSIEGFEATLKAHKLPRDPHMLAYGYFHESTLTPEDAISRAITGTLSKTSVDAARIDMLIVVSADVGFLAGNRGLMPRVLTHTGLSRALPLTMTSQECTGLLSAIDMGRRYVCEGTCRNVVVVSYDKARDDAERIQSFGVFSDAAVACLISADSPLEFQMGRFSHRSDLRGMNGGDDFSSRENLIKQVTMDVLGQEKIPLSDIKKVFATNFFKPLATFNAWTMGLDEQQVYMEITPDIGHCLCGDPLINLDASVRHDKHWRRGDRLLLQAYAPGFLASLLIEHATDAVTAPSRGVEAMADVVVQSW